MKETFGQRFARLRKGLGLKQEDIASRVNISAQAVSKWENDISSPDISLLPELADILQVSLDELLGRTTIQTEIVPVEKRKNIQKMILRIEVKDEECRLKVNLPIALIMAFLEGSVSMPSVNGKDVLGKIDFQSVIQLIEQGVVGKLVEMETSDNESVSIWVE